MKRPVLTTCLAVFAAFASPALAENSGTRVQEAIIAQLSAQGFTHVRISNTILGRVRIFATSAEATREIIFNPRTGEILRDYWDDDDEFAGGLVSPPGSGMTRGGTSAGDGGDPDDDDADDDDDEDDDDDDDEDEDDEDDD